MAEVPTRVITTLPNIYDGFFFAKIVSALVGYARLYVGILFLCNIEK